MEPESIILDINFNVREEQILELEYKIARELIESYKIEKYKKTTISDNSSIADYNKAHYVNNKAMTLKNSPVSSRIGREYVGANTLFTGLLMCNMSDYVENCTLLKDNHPELNNFFAFVSNNMRSNTPRQKILHLITEKLYDVNYIFSYTDFLTKDVKSVLLGYLTNHGSMISYHNSPDMFHLNNLTVPLLAATNYTDKPILREALKQKYDVGYKSHSKIDEMGKITIAKFLNEVLDEYRINHKTDYRANHKCFPDNSQYRTANNNSLIDLYEKKQLKRSLLDLFNEEIDVGLKNKKEQAQYEVFLDKYNKYTEYKAQKSTGFDYNIEHKKNELIVEAYKLMDEDNLLFLNSIEKLTVLHGLIDIRGRDTLTIAIIAGRENFVEKLITNKILPKTNLEVLKEHTKKAYDINDYLKVAIEMKKGNISKYLVTNEIYDLEKLKTHVPNSTTILDRALSLKLKTTSFLLYKLGLPISS